MLAISHGHATVLSETTCLISISAVHDSRFTIHHFTIHLSNQLPALSERRERIAEPCALHHFVAQVFNLRINEAQLAKSRHNHSPSSVDLGKTVRLPWMERIVHKSRNHREAQAWEQTQYQKMTPAERLRIARTLKRRAYPGPQPDVRGWHRKA